MTTEYPPSPARGAIIFGSAIALCLIAPLVVFLSTNHYDLLAPEAAVLYAAALAVGAIACSTVLLRFESLSSLILWACVVLAIAFLLDGLNLRMLALTALLAGIVIWRLKKNAPFIALVVASTHIATSVALNIVDQSSYKLLKELPPSKTATADPALPPVLHLLLDEYSGLNGISSATEDGALLATQIARKYVEHGFTISSHAYSQYFETINSIPNLLNFASDSVSRNFVDSADEGFSLNQNDYFRNMTDRGYSLHVYQSQYFDFCSTETSQMAACNIYRTNSIGTIADIELPLLQKSKFLFNSYVDSPLTLRKLRRRYDRAIDQYSLPLPKWRTGNSHAGQIAVLKVIDDLNSRLVNIAPGEMHFAHLLLPHYPYSLNEDCSIKQDVGDWLNRVPFEISHPVGRQNTSDSRDERYEAYFSQLGCIEMMLDETFAAVQSSGHWDNSIIIIHSDHGSRIVEFHPLESNLKEMTGDDYRDAYSAFFAVKSQTSNGMVHSDPTSIQSLLADVWDIPDVEVNPDQVYMRKIDDHNELTATPLVGFDSAPE